VARRDRPSPATLAAWEEFLRTHLELVRRLDHDLVERHGIPLAWYDVLVQLNACGGEATMGVLAQRLLIVPSTCTRLVERMAVVGLVERHVDEHDARVRRVELTRRGRSQLTAAAVTHLAGIQRHFGRFMTDDAASDLADRFQAMRKATGSPLR
jgi:DNA-binding MarR family transcriptional regulator